MKFTVLGFKKQDYSKSRRETSGKQEGSREKLEKLNLLEKK